MNDNSNIQYTALYDECRDMVCRNSAPVLNAHREAAYGTVSTTPLPDRKTEEHKYTDPSTRTTLSDATCRTSPHSCTS